MSINCDKIPLSVYVHFPWCVRKCPYCDFNSHTVREELPEKQYLAALLSDLAQELQYVTARQVVSIFCGGGTPSLFSGRMIARLLKAIQAHLPLHPQCEITLEANPGTVEHDSFFAYKEAGINRISLGVQSFDAAHLARLGRIHSPTHSQAAFIQARQAGFANINIDLMHGLPQQTTAQALADLEQALALGPEHISWYQLTLEPNTVFYKKPPTLPQEAILAEIETAGLALLQKHAWERYEISAYARPGFRCRHNLNYWQFGDFIGIGAGAHGKITDPVTGKIIRRRKHRVPNQYMISTQKVAEQHALSPADKRLEFMLNQARLFAKIPLRRYYEYTGLTFAALAEPLQRARELGLLDYDEEFIYISEHGYRFLDDLVNVFNVPLAASA